MALMFRVRTVFTGVEGTPWLSTMYFSGAVGTPQDAADAVGVFWADVETHIAGSVEWTTEAAVYSIDDTDGQATGLNNTTVSTGSGAGGGSIMPLADQALVRMHTGEFVGGREIRGRIFVPGIATAATNGNVPSAVITNINGAAATLISDVSQTWVVWSRAHSQFQPVVSADTWAKFAVLRSRRD